jgi:hypothetical protein
MWNSLLISSRFQPPSHLPTAAKVLRKGHRLADYGLSFFAVAVFFFALLVLYVVTHMNAQLTSELKSTIKSQQKKLRKFGRRQAEARRKMQLKGMKGTVGVQEHVEETGYGGTLVIDRSRW